MPSNRIRISRKAGVTAPPYGTWATWAIRADKAKLLGWPQEQIEAYKATYGTEYKEVNHAHK